MATGPDSDQARSKAPEPDYCEYQAELRRFFRSRAHDPHAADDCAQMVYAQLLGAQPKEPIRNPRAYFWQVARQVLHRENGRTRDLQSKMLSGDAQIWDRVLPCTEDDAQTALIHDGLEAALRELPAHQQTVLTLQYCDKLTYKQIAKKLSLSTHAVKKYVCQALDTIRSKIGQDAPDPGKDPTGAAS